MLVGLAGNVSIISDTTESAANTTAGDDALKNPVVGLTALARRVEAAHFPDSTATRDVVPKTTTGKPPCIGSLHTMYVASSLTGSASNVSIISDTTESAANPTAGDDEVKSKPSAKLNPAAGNSNHTTLCCSYLHNSSNSYGSGD